MRKFFGFAQNDTKWGAFCDIIPDILLKSMDIVGIHANFGWISSQKCVIVGMGIVDENSRIVYNNTMFNLQHILYMLISGLLTILLLFMARKFVTGEQSKNFILK